MNDRIGLVIMEMRRKKFNSRYDKKPKTYSPSSVLNIYDNELIPDDIKEIVKEVQLNQLPTIEVLRSEIKNAIEMIKFHHNNQSSTLKHNCCFESYYHKIIMLIEIMLSKEYVYSHRFVKEYMREK